MEPKEINQFIIHLKGCNNSPEEYKKTNITSQYAIHITIRRKKKNGTSTIQQFLCIYLLVILTRATANLILLHITIMKINQIAANPTKT